MVEEDIPIFESYLVPKHEIMDEDQKTKLMQELNIIPKQLPIIKIDDPAIKSLNPKTGDVIKVTRKSPVAGKCLYYRVVV